MTKFAGCYIIRLKMKFRHILTIGAIAAISLIGCKKDETPVYESFNGSVKFDLQSYVSPGDVIRLAEYPERTASLSDSHGRSPRS